MAEPLPGLVQGDDLKSLYAQKAKPYDEKTISANSKRALDLKLAGEQTIMFLTIREEFREIDADRQRFAISAATGPIWVIKL